MATAITPSLRASLERLKHAGAVNGLCLGWRRQVLVNLLPYEDFRAERVLHMVADARDHFNGGGTRKVDSLWFGYEGVHLLTLTHDECTLIILHSRSSDVDFLTKAGLTFLQDTQLLVTAALHPSDSDISNQDTQPIAREEADEGELPGTQTHVIARR
jgi:hypothetical protein